MKTGVLIAITAGFALGGVLYIYRDRIREMLNRLADEEDIDWSDRTTYGMSELMSDDSDTFDDLRSRLNDEERV
jgi:hypothetical protein